MEKCQYILERDLPSPATDEQLETILEALADPDNSVNFGHSAEKWLADTNTPEQELCGAIDRHIRAGRKVFRKFEKGSKTKLLPDDVQANVTIFNDEDDLYVSIWIQPGIIINIYAHEHPTGRHRLPQ